MWGEQGTLCANLSSLRVKAKGLSGVWCVRWFAEALYSLVLFLFFSLSSFFLLFSRSLYVKRILYLFLCISVVPSALRFYIDVPWKRKVSLSDWKCLLHWAQSSSVFMKYKVCIYTKVSGWFGCLRIPSNCFIINISWDLLNFSSFVHVNLGDARTEVFGHWFSFCCLPYWHW